MNKAKHDQRRDLLSDVLTPGPADSFREDLHGCCLRALTWRRRRRAWGRGLAAAAAVTLLAGTYVLRPHTQGTPTAGHAAPGFYVRTQPLESAAVVHTAPHARVEVVKTESALPVAIETKDAARRAPAIISDTELLACFADRPVALIRQDAARARLVFAAMEPENEPDRGLHRSL